MAKITRRFMLAAVPACGLAPIVPAMAEPVISSKLSELIASYAILRDQYFAQEDGFKADEVGKVWIPLFYEIVEFPCRTAADAVAKARLMVSAADKNEMHIFEDDGLTALRTIAALPQA